MIPTFLAGCHYSSPLSVRSLNDSKATIPEAIHAAGGGFNPSVTPTTFAPISSHARTMRTEHPGHKQVSGVHVSGCGVVTV